MFLSICYPLVFNITKQRYLYDVKFDKSYTALALAELCHAEVIGDPNHILTGMNEIHKVTVGDLMFVDNEKYFQKSIDSSATAILINKKIDPPIGKVF